MYVRERQAESGALRTSSQQCPRSKMSSSVPVNVVNTQWSNPLLFQQRCDKTVERKFLIMLSCEQNKSKPIS